MISIKLQKCDLVLTIIALYKLLLLSGRYLQIHNGKRYEDSKKWPVYRKKYSL